jgi:DNA-binding transcriptional ArsR family regulator
MAMSRAEKNNAVILSLNHPLRREILRRLADSTNGGVSPSMLAEDIPAPIGNVSYHVRCLLKAGVLKLEKVEPRRGAIEHFYTRAGNSVDKKVTELLAFIGKD